MTDKEAFELAVAEQQKIVFFLDKPRCINCERWTAGKCEVYGAVPEAHWYTPNECKEWYYKIPF